MVLRIFGLFVVAGFAMALFAFGMSFVISVDATHLHAAMFVSILAFFVIGMFCSIRYFIRVSRGHHDLSGK
jgi:hypothetical protein